MLYNIAAHFGVNAGSVAAAFRNAFREDAGSAAAGCRVTILNDT